MPSFKTMDVDDKGKITKIRNRFTAELVTNPRARISWTPADRLAFLAHLARTRAHADTLDNDAQLRTLVETGLGIELERIPTVQQRRALRKRILGALQYRLRCVAIELNLKEVWNDEKECREYIWPDNVVREWSRPDWNGKCVLVTHGDEGGEIGETTSLGGDGDSDRGGDGNGDNDSNCSSDNDSDDTITIANFNSGNRTQNTTGMQQQQRQHQQKRQQQLKMANDSHGYDSESDHDSEMDVQEEEEEKEEEEKEEEGKKSDSSLTIQIIVTYQKVLNQLDELGLAISLRQLQRQVLVSASAPGLTAAVSKELQALQHRRSRLEYVFDDLCGEMRRGGLGWAVGLGGSSGAIC